MAHAVGYSRPPRCGYPSPVRAAVTRHGATCQMRPLRLGGPKAVTAMAHKLARVLWHRLKFQVAFDGNVFAKEEEKMQRKKLARLQNLAASLKYQLTPLP